MGDRAHRAPVALARRAAAPLANLARRARGALISAGLMEYRPPPPPGLALQREWYESGGWDYLGSIHQLPRYSILAGYLAYCDCRSILDVGCGAGLLRGHLEGVQFERYVGIDPVAAAIERAAALADDRTQFIVGDVFLPDLGQFDAVVCNEVLYGVPQPRSLLERVRELMRPHGYFLTSDIRHAGDGGLRRLLAELFDPVTAVDVSNRSERGSHGRRVALYRSRRTDAA